MDNNWITLKETTEEISDILGIPPETSEKYLEVVENLLIHNLIDSFNDNPHANSFTVQLPYLGSLVLEINDNGKISTSFTPSSRFYRKIKSAYSTRKSPLTRMVGIELGNLISSDEGGELYE